MLERVPFVRTFSANIYMVAQRCEVNVTAKRKKPMSSVSFPLVTVNVADGFDIKAHLDKDNEVRVMQSNDDEYGNRYFIGTVNSESKESDSREVTKSEYMDFCQQQGLLTTKETAMPKPEKPGEHGKGKDKDGGRDIDKWLPPKRPWVAVTIPAADIVSEEILFDRATQQIEILGHQFDEDGEQIPRKMDVKIEESEDGASLIISHKAMQVLYKVVDADEDEDDNEDRVLL